MAEDGEELELIKMLNLAEGEGVDERLRRWAQAFETWLEARCSRYHRTVGLLTHQAWREFLALSAKAPWEVEAEDVNAYVRTLEARGVRPKTVANLLAPLGSFYAYCQENGVDALCGPGH